MGPYGTNTPAVRRFLQRFAALDSQQWAEAATAFETLERTPEFMAADRALGLAIERSDLVAARDAVVGPLLQLVRPADGDASTVHPVAAAALSALLALVARDVLDATTFATLYRAFDALVPLEALGPSRT